MTEPPIVPLGIFLAFLLVFCIVCVFWPKKIQSVAIRSSSSWPEWFVKYYPFARWAKEWIATPGYLHYLRVIGGFFVFAVLCIATLLIAMKVSPQR